VDDEFRKAVDKYIQDELKLEGPKDDWKHEDWQEYKTKIAKALDLPEDFDEEKVWYNLNLRVDLVNQPGKVMAYSNYGYDRLRDIICAITGESIDSYARRVLLDPLGMIDSHWILPKEKYGRVLGRGERCTGHGWINSENCYNNEGGGNGLKTTVNDLTNFSEMILANGRYKGQRILSPASIREMTANYNKSLANAWDSWSLGWNYRGIKVDDAGVLRSAGCVEHGGWAGHKILADREYGLAIVCFTGEYEGGKVFPGFGRINNMIIAACE
jgi:CubicO group peptidase (beta-lactamase class C family)